MYLKKILIRIYQVLGQFGIDPIMFVRSIRALPLFFLQFRQFLQGYTGKIILMPFLQERYAEGGVTKTEYFWQDLIVARSIFAMKPERHVDVGSSVEGFVAHVASFREIEVIDVRPITTVIPGVVFRQADMMDPDSLLRIKEAGHYDSLSCLHAIEHFGLGRYGDPINPRGHEFGIANMAKMLKGGGYFYLSAPIGQERVVFNANRVFDPRTIVRCANENGLILRKFTVIAAGGVVKILPLTDESFQEFSRAYYNLGLFIFEKSVEP